MTKGEFKMKFRSLLGIGMALCMILSTLCMPACVFATAETPEVYVLDDGTMEKQFIHATKPEYQEITDSGIRMFDKTYKITPGSDANRQFGSYLPGASSSKATEYGNDFQYKYVNFWVYSPKALTAEDSNDGKNIPNITFAVYRGPNVGAMGALYKNVTVGWEGWKLVSIPIENMSYRNGKKLSDTFSNSGNTTQSNQIQSWYIFANWSQTGTDAVKWKANTGDYYLIDYVYLSKEAPPQTNLTVTETTVDAAGKIIFTLNREIAANSVVKSDKATVKKKNSGEILSGTLAINPENHKQLVYTSDDRLEADAEYEATLASGTVYDIYGFTNSSTEAAVKKLYQFSGESHGMVEVENQYSNEDPPRKASLDMSEENARMFNKTLKYTIVPSTWANSQNYGQSKYHASLADSPVSTEDYDYVNAWIYSNGLPKASNGTTPSTLNLAVQSSITYAVPIDWDDGWRLVSIPIRAFNGTNDAVFPAGNITNIELNTSFAGNYNGQRWTNGGEVLVDYIYLSKGLPIRENVAIIGNNLSDLQNVENGNRVSVDGELTFTAARELVPEAVHADKVIVKKNETVIEGGYKLKIDSNDVTKVKLIFDNGLQPDTNYSITFGECAVYDMYGNPNDMYDEITFTTEKVVPYTVSDITITSAGNDLVTAATEVRVNDSQERSFMLIVAQYDGNHNLVDVACTQPKIVGAMDNSSAMLSQDIALQPETKTVKAMLWDDWESMNPYISAKVFNVTTSN